ncbi:hypothetical protein [Wolbachia endosymbiont of Phyllotreta cruciferae]|uniref:hypothetical protein n=1 Tax=Wolbachia endosymbiont of Phyllotreta cruciferae TaxID=2886377 RepID=UPI0020A18843|nr:hypothetical protein [Wolbachia endosymbiont of Phyllotreta cruciferae]
MHNHMKAHSSLSFQRVTLSNDVIPVLDTGSFMTTVPRGVIPVLDTGMALLHRYL